ncbi:hypothetical protein Tco_0667225 [Tanacetum coccineum]
MTWHAKEMTWHATRKYTEHGLQHVADDIDNIQSASVVMYEREFFYADVAKNSSMLANSRFLKKPHKWRRSLKFNGETEDEDPPREFSRDAIMTQLARLPTRVKGKHLRFGGVKIKRNVLVELN